jgi:hypothetical protein
MNHSEYCSLLRQVSSHFNMQDDQWLLDTGLLHVAGYDVQLVHDEYAMPGVVCIRIDLGLGNSDDEAALMKSLLACNLDAGRDGRFVFGMMDIGRVVLDLQHPLGDRMTGVAFASQLRHLLMHAAHFWQQLHRQGAVCHVPFSLRSRWWRLPGSSFGIMDDVGFDGLILRLRAWIGTERERGRRLAGITEAVRLDGVDLQLRYDDAVAPNRCEVCIDLGAPRPEMLPDLWAHLLMMNFRSGPAGRVAFGLRMGDGHVVCSLQQELDAVLSGEEFGALLRERIEEARGYWGEVCGLRMLRPRRRA